jgi:hypothetical protein
MRVFKGVAWHPQVLRTLVRGGLCHGTLLMCTRQVGAGSPSGVRAGAVTMR